MPKQELKQDSNMFGLIGTAISSAVGAGMNAVNARNQQRINSSNRAESDYWNTINYMLNREQFEYSKDLTNRVFAREDSALQRGVADASAAGLSPLAASAAGSSVGAGSFASSPGFSISQGAAYNQDATPIISAINQASSNMTQYAIAKLQSSDKAADRQSQEKLAGLQIQAQKDMCNANISANAEIEDKRLAQEDLKMNLDYKKYLGTLDYQIKALNSAVSSRNFSVYSQANQATIDSIKNWAASAGVRVEFKPFDVNSDKDLDTIKERNELFDSQVQAGYKSYSSWRETASPEQLAALYSKSSSSSKSDALGGSLGATAPVGSSLGPLGGATLGLNKTKSDASSDSETISQSNQVNTIRMSEFFPKTLTYYYPSYNESYYKAMHTK